MSTLCSFILHQITSAFSQQANYSHNPDKRLQYSVTKEFVTRWNTNAGEALFDASFSLSHAAYGRITAPPSGQMYTVHHVPIQLYQSHYSVACKGCMYMFVAGSN